MKTVLITGATSGLGRYLAEKLSIDGNYKVLLHGRDQKRTESLAAELSDEPYVANLSDLSQVRRLADEVLKKNEKLDILINNAGIGYGKQRELSADGHELRLAVMYLAPVLLTRLLLPHITSQILNIGSLGQESIDLDDLMFEKNYSGVSAYRRAKLALLMHTFDLAKERADLKINIIHPATYMDTNMVRGGGGTPLNTVEHGGEATLRVLNSTLSGRFFDEDRPADINSGVHADAYQDELRQKLRRMTDAILEKS